MSVINKMLRDLDKQQQERGHSPLVLQNSTRINWLPWLIIPLALLAGWWGQAWFSRDEATKALPVVADQQTPPAQLSPLPGVAATPEPLQQQPVAKPAEVQTVQAENTAPTLTEPLAAEPQSAAVARGATQEPPAMPEPAPLAAAPAEAEQQVAAVETVATEQDEPHSDWLQEPALAPEPAAKSTHLAIEKVQLSPAEQLALLSQQARKAESAGQTALALQLWQKASTVLPTEAEAYLQQARLWQLQANFAAAEQALQQGLERGVTDPALAMALAALAVRQQRWPDVIRLLNTEPEFSLYPDFYALKATALQKTGQHAQAVSLFQQLARLQPQQARWWLGMALSFDAMAQPEQALLAYRQAEKQGQNLAADSLNFVRSRIAELE
ncbi:hypothetical protein [Rheinheimera sp.]|uniref:hypothetical protein n=1 Tax=Rheinheimera sp. TaxID=1869214 RepID=UPI00307ED076